MTLQKSNPSNAYLSKKLNEKVLIQSLWIINIACVFSMIVLVTLFYYMMLQKDSFNLSFSVAVALLAILFALVIKYLLIFNKKMKIEKHAYRSDSRNVFYWITLIVNFLILIFGLIALKILFENSSVFS